MIGEHEKAQSTSRKVRLTVRVFPSATASTVISGRDRKQAAANIPSAPTSDTTAPLILTVAFGSAIPRTLISRGSAGTVVPSHGSVWT